MTDLVAHDKTVAYWLKQLEAEHKAHKEWREKAKKVYQAYQPTEKSDKFPVLWSNTEILKGALYANTAKPDVRRRNIDTGTQHKQIALAVERAISYQVDTQRFDSHIKRGVQDFLVAAMGQVRIKYEVEGEEEITNQRCTIECYSYDHFRYEPAKSWEKVGWVCFDHAKKASEIKKEFNVELADAPVDDKGRPTTVLVHEIYCKKDKKIYVITKNHDEPLEVREDKLGLNSFYPCPQPMFANLRTDKLIPKPDYLFYQNQAARLSVIEDRIDAIAESIKDIGFYEASFSDLKSLEGAVDGDLIPVDGLRQVLEGGTKLDDVIATMPIEHKVNVLRILREEQHAIKETIYEITGISDIIRGQSVASESATAQQIKGKWGDVRLTDRRNVVNEFIRETFRLMAEVISEHFTPEILMQQTGIKLSPEDQQILKTDSLRGFAIDVETDSTVAVDEQAEQEQRLNMLSTVTEYINGILPAIQQGMMPVNLGVELLLTAVRSFKYGRNLEEMVSAIGQEDSPEAQVQQLGQQLQEMQQQLEQVHMQASQEIQMRDDQLGQAQGQIAQLSNTVSELEQREQARKESETEATVALKSAQANKANAEAAATLVPDQPV